MDNTEDSTLRALALVALREWLAHPDWKPDEKLSKVWDSTSLGQEVRRREADHWQWWKGDARGAQLRHLHRAIPERWEQEGWVEIKQHRQGRPRRAEHPASRVSRALSAYRDGHGEGRVTEKTYRWAESILGERNTYNEARVVTPTTKLLEELAEAAGDENLDGRTRQQLAEELNLTAALANHLTRWLQETGEWEEKQERADGKRQRVLRRKQG